MRLPHPMAVLRALVWPLRASLPRAVAEGIVLAGCLLALSISQVPLGQAGASLLGGMAWVSLTIWPAWRLREARPGPRWRRLPRRVGRTLACGIAVGCSALILQALAAPTRFPDTQAAAQLSFGVTGGFTALFIPVRLAVVTAATLARRARRRLRWQLTASHMAVIALTFAAMSALGSTVALNLGVAAFNPNARDFAQSVASLIRYTNAAPALDRARVVAAIRGIDSGELATRGQGLLPALSAASRPPHRIIILDARGATVAQILSAPFVSTQPHTPSLDPALVQRLRRAALAGGHPTEPTPVRDGIAGQGQTLYRTATSAAAILGPRGQPIGVALVQVLDISLSSDQFVSSVLSFFGVSTFILFLASALPILAVSSMFGYLLARGLSRRLEAVSRVTRAIAAGDLTQRAPVAAQHEVGRLADDVNRMAEHLQAAMGGLRQASMKAENALRARQELVASISHELRTPLAIIQAHLEALDTAEPGAAEVSPGQVALPLSTLHALRNETGRLAGLVDDLFSLARAETGALQVQCAPTDVAALVQDVAALMRPLAQRDGLITLAVEARPDVPPAMADAARLRQILENLVRNAVRHTPEGGIIVLSVTAEGPWVSIAVADTGEGMPPEHLPHIFERFYRVDQARTRTSGGAGLGLAIVREFVQLMGGQVDVESVPGEGSCFRVRLTSTSLSSPLEVRPATGRPLPSPAP